MRCKRKHFRILLWCTVLDGVQEAIRQEGQDLYIPEFDEFGGLLL